ncbi:hypothetical protein H5410_021038 [Solanum commersonii]|uniref:Uncharacterized protein n=1 Tax=Solanum commersonii TaxID=4109 RepID=A0A9J5ZBK0_SOLCO|nr:hypothetical protein H5410_021038 [Solanum commersonii]
MKSTIQEFYYNLLRNLQVGDTTSIYRRLQKLATRNTSCDTGNLRKKAQHLTGSDFLQVTRFLALMILQ